MALLELRDVAKSYGAVKALEGASFTVDEGEIVALVGDNGAGKSTTAKIIAGALAPDDGVVSFDGRARSWDSPREARLAGVEMVYQDMALASHLSATANIFLGREARRGGLLGRLGFLDWPTMSHQAEKTLLRLRVDVPVGDYPVAGLSGGQRQAIAIAKALNWHSKLLILDEPTNHLGVSGTQQVLQLMRNARDDGVGIILISHTIPQVLDVADRIVVLWQGHVAAEIPASEATLDRVVAHITGSGAL